MFWSRNAIDVKRDHYKIVKKYVLQIGPLKGSTIKHLWGMWCQKHSDVGQKRRGSAFDNGQLWKKSLGSMVTFLCLINKTCQS